MDYFNIKKETPLAIYGAGNIGKQKCRELINAGYQVISLIDKNAKRISPFCNIPILTIEDFCQEFHGRKEIVIIICLNNGMQHEATARKLAVYGYNKILYIPMDEKNGYSYFSEMQYAYSAFLNGKVALLNKIPVYFSKHDNTSEEPQVLAMDLEDVTFLCEIEYLFSPNEEMIRESAASENILRKTLESPEYIDRPIVTCKNYINLYDYIMGSVPYPDLYMRYFGKDKEYNQALLEDRINLFYCYKQRYETNIELFYLQPSTAEWNPKGYFNIYDGMHRAMFLYYVKNHLKIPVRTRKSAFNKFLSCHKGEKCIYKSKQLILQEHLSEHFDIYSSKGGVLGADRNDLAIEYLKKVSKDIVFLKGMKECLNSKNRFDYIFMPISLLASCTAKTARELFYISPRILIECTEDSTFIKNLISDITIEEIGSVLGQDLRRIYFYLLERKGNEQFIF